mgnify:CR=1 FL=1
MKKKTSNRMLRQSCAWIKDHWNATNLEVPDEFVRQWMYEPGEDEMEPNGFFLGVFTFGYLQHQIIANNVPTGVRQSVPASRLFELFQVWQLKLAMAEIHRKTDVRMKPMPLFDFPAGEQIEYWRVPLQA